MGIKRIVALTLTTALTVAAGFGAIKYDNNKYVITPDKYAETATKVEEVAEVAPVVPVVETPVEEPKVEEDYTIPQEPVIDSSIEDLLNKDYSSNNEIVNNIPEEIKEEPVTPVVPVVETPKSKYNNDKKLSDIFGKKEEPKIKNIETTQDFSDELDRILKKLNEDAKNSPALEETSDYTNMF